MPAAQKKLENEPFWTRLWLTMLWGGNTAYWSPLAHRNTGWEFWVQPDGENVPMWKLRRSVDEATVNSVPYQNSIATNPNTKEQYKLPTESHVLAHSSSIWAGTYNGEPVQSAKVENGRTVFRSVSYGYPWQQNKYARVPVTKDPVLHCGDPNWASDRHANIYDPSTGDMHELISYDENVADTPVSNQALGWGRWNNGVLVEGEAATATGNSITSTLWDRDSITDPHTLGFVTFDYEGADGTPGFKGPVAGALYFLPTNSPSYKAMYALGGECRAVVQAMNKHGVLLQDRSGYGYDDAPDNTAPGKAAKTPGLGIQWGAWTRTTNLHLLKVSVHDLRMVVG